MSKYNELVKKLKEIFQIDRPELDFGVYRILNARSAEISDYLDNRLKAKVVESLAAAGSTSLDSIKRELEEKIAQYRADGIDPESVPRVKELRLKVAEVTSGSSEHENAVFTQLLTFFSRYYVEGDFISQRRYKGDTYSIPYAGEEVMLHWANKDQYYTKSGENFTNYAFKLDDGRTVRFKLIAADTAKDNRKDNDKERRFVLIEDGCERTLVDDSGDDFQESYDAIAEENGELFIRFEYKAMPKGTKQIKLTEEAVQEILKNKLVKNGWPQLASREPTEANPERTLLEKCLVNFTNKNSADYFIHKDLGGFLRSELDFYIKNEVMKLDDVQVVENFSDIEKNLRLIQTLRSISFDLITFLANLEDFQKRLWLKKKFVVSTNYCITLDLIPENLYPEISDNEKQWKQWIQLGLVEKQPAKSSALKYLKDNKSLMADTSLYEVAFKFRFLEKIENLDDSINGLLVHGDNFQALSLIQPRYSEQIKCIHIDPPYNTETSGFLYKNNFLHSSWLSMIRDRATVAANFLNKNGSFICHIDENEIERLQILLAEIFPVDSGVLIWDKGAPVTGANGLASQHEYVIFKSLTNVKLKSHKKNLEKMNVFAMSLLEKHKNIISSDLIAEWRKWLKNQNDLSKAELIYDFVDEKGRVYRSADMTATDQRTDVKFFKPLMHPLTKKACPVPKYGWRYTPDTMQKHIDAGNIIFGEDHTKIPRRKVYIANNETSQMPTIYTSGYRGKPELDSLGLGFPFAHSTEFYSYLLNSTYDEGEIDYTILDFFAGSGTTGHAAVNLNRLDQGKRKYILVEQGEYFETVTKPRMIKVVYSSVWKEGKPVAPQTGVSQIIKILKIEGYEDTLNNLQLKRTSQAQGSLDLLSDTAREDYLLKYMLNLESKDSLLNSDQFKKPFDKKLKVSVDSAGAFEERSIDLVETFNYLIGLKVKHIDANFQIGYLKVTGQLPSGEKALVLWRDTEKISYEKFNDLCQNKLAINPKDNEYDVVYINGDHNIPTVFTSTETEGSSTKVLKLKQIEPEFLDKMFKSGVV